MGLLYQKRRLKVNRIKRQINANRRALQRVRVLLALCLMCAICFFGYKALKLPQWYISTNKLNSADKNVFMLRGNQITPSYKIYDAIRQTQAPYTQIFRLNTKELEENISQLQSIKKVYIRRFWFPARMIIALEERTPAFLLVPNLDSEPNSILTTDGVLLDHDYLPLNPSIKAKKLLTYGVRNGVDEVWDKKKVDTLIKLSKMIETYSNQEVKYIDIRNEKDVYIAIEEYLIRFGEINELSLNRVKNIASILPEARKINQKIKYIDLRWDDSYYLRLDGSKDTSPKDVEVKTKIDKKSKPQEENQSQNEQVQEESEEELD